MDRDTLLKRRLAREAWAALDKWHDEGFDVRLHPEEREAVLATLAVLNEYAMGGA